MKPEFSQEVDDWIDSIFGMDRTYFEQWVQAVLDNPDCLSWSLT